MRLSKEVQERHERLRRGERIFETDENGERVEIVVYEWDHERKGYFKLGEPNEELDESTIID